MTDTTTPATAVTPAAPPSAPTPAPAAPAVKSGWQTTEMYLAVVLLAGIGYIDQQLIAILPALAQNPAAPPWLSALVPVAIVGLTGLGALITKEYINLRGQLKLGAGVDPSVAAAQAAGAQAAGAANAAALAQANK